MSYDIASQPTDYDAISLEKLIERERNPELREALEDLDDFYLDGKLLKFESCEVV